MNEKFKTYRKFGCIFVIIIILSIVAGITMSSVGLENIINEIICKNNGGLWTYQVTPPRGYNMYVCLEQYSDGGKRCRNSSDCQGDCVLEQNEYSEAFCKFGSGLSDAPPFWLRDQERYWRDCGFKKDSEPRCQKIQSLCNAGPYAPQKPECNDLRPHTYFEFNDGKIDIKCNNCVISG